MVKKNDEPKKGSVIRKIYLYLFSIIGLVLIVIGSVGIIDLALKAWIFTDAEGEENYYTMQPPRPYLLEKTKLESENNALTAEEKEAITNWMADYELWQEQNKDYDPIKSRRQRQAANNIAMILVGLPLYLFHWRIIRRETD